MSTTNAPTVKQLTSHIFHFFIFHFLLARARQNVRTNFIILPFFRFHIGRGRGGGATAAAEVEAEAATAAVDGRAGAGTKIYFLIRSFILRIASLI